MREESQLSVTQLPTEYAERIRSRILKDMNPPLTLVNAKLALAVVLGGCMSLSICGQFGMGMTGWAEVLSHRIHAEMPSLACAAICGMVYAIFPTLVLRLLLCSPMQFQVILKKHFVLLTAWYFGVALALASYGQHGQQTEEVLFWTVAAVLTSYGVSYIMRTLLPRVTLSRI